MFNLDKILCSIFQLICLFYFTFSNASVSQCPANNNNISTVLGSNILDPKKIRQSYQNIDFPLRGEIYYKTAELANELTKGVKKPFSEIIRAGVVDSQSTGQKPNTFLRQLVALVSFPQLLEQTSTFPSDVVTRAKYILNDLGGASIGSLTDPRGITVIRKQVAKFISDRDAVSASFEDIFLTNGVSGGLEIAFQLVQTENCKDTGNAGVMVPIPLYPLYSALITKYDLRQINYNLNPDKEWSTEIIELERAYNEALCSCKCKPRVLVIINPGNPSAKILRQSEIQEIIRFAYNRNLLLFADEIYQHNLLADTPFVSIRKVLNGMEIPYKNLELITFHSISKGFMSEGGLRGGYLELTNIRREVGNILNNIVTVKQCPNILGQVGVYALVNPPKIGEASHELFEKEKLDIHSSHKIVAAKMVTGLNAIKGLHCDTLEGGVVAFTKITVPEKAKIQATTLGHRPDNFYGLELLKQTGLNVAVGSAFGLSHNQTYLRISLPSTVEKCEKILGILKTFNQDFLSKYA